jgi:hypothetical protein
MFSRSGWNQFNQSVDLETLPEVIAEKTGLFSNKFFW